MLQLSLVGWSKKKKASRSSVGWYCVLAGTRHRTWRARDFWLRLGWALVHVGARTYCVGFGMQGRSCRRALAWVVRKFPSPCPAHTTLPVLRSAATLLSSWDAKEIKTSARKRDFLIRIRLFPLLRRRLRSFCAFCPSGFLLARQQSSLATARGPNRLTRGNRPETADATSTDWAAPPDKFVAIYRGVAAHNWQ